MTLTDRFDAALTFTADKHRYQKRKGGDIPYIAHLLHVCGLVLESGGNEDEAIADLLHDVMEDQDVTCDELTAKFGLTVAEIVAACSDSESSVKGPWKDRKTAYIAHIADASPSVRLVSSCDKLHNARAILADYQEIGDELWKRFNASRSEILWYYSELAKAFEAAEVNAGEPTSRIVRQLRLVVEELNSDTGSSDADLPN
jgi:(p)ppGpp synthase/HD superfamily hydrolase